VPGHKHPGGEVDAEAVGVGVQDWQIVFQEYIRAVTDHTERLTRLEQELTDQV
jgi:UTP-glucose-1-phosphate uridylyltransferase